MKKIIYGGFIVFISFILLVYVDSNWPWSKPQMNIGELKTFISEQLSDSNPGVSINNVELEITKEDKGGRFDRIHYTGLIQLTKADGAKGMLKGTVIARYIIGFLNRPELFGREVPEDLYPRMGPFYIDWEFNEEMTVGKIEEETRKALGQKFRGATVESLSLQKQEGNKYTGTVEITDPHGSKIKLELNVTDYGGGRIFLETK